MAEELTTATARRFIEQERFNTDERRHLRSPDEDAGRRREFLTGWRQGVAGGTMTKRTLRALTWRNLGWRAGRHFAGEDPAEAFRIFVAVQNGVGESPEREKATRALRTLLPFVRSVAELSVEALNKLSPTDAGDRGRWDEHTRAELVSLGGTLGEALERYVQQPGLDDDEVWWRIGRAALPFIDASQAVLSAAAALVGVEFHHNSTSLQDSERPGRAAWHRKTPERAGPSRLKSRGFNVKDGRKIDDNASRMPWSVSLLEQAEWAAGASGYFVRDRVGLELQCGVDHTRSCLFVAARDLNGQQRTLHHLDDGVQATEVRRVLEDVSAMVSKLQSESSAISPQSVAELHDVQRLQEHLRAQAAVVLQGPPGTGKTRRALRLVEYLATNKLGDAPASLARLETFRWTTATLPRAESDWRDLPVLWEVVQLHPSYAYEDLVRGLTTKPAGGGVEFVVEDKLLVQLARAASERGDKPTILILDEINRCNLSAVLGELILVLEKGYRDMPVRLQYVNPQKANEATLTLPDNLWIIGTMNTADRSIAMVDFAIRRRFRFIDVKPSEDVIRQVNSARFSEQAAEQCRAVFERFQELLPEDARQQLSVGHSYFLLDPSLTNKAGAPVPWQQQLRDRVEYEVLPLIREYDVEGLLKTAQEKWWRTASGAFTKLGIGDDDGGGE